MPRQVLFDAGRNDSLDRCARLDRFDFSVEAIEDDDSFGARCQQRVLRFAFGVRWIEWAGNRTNLPGAELRNHELRTIWQANRDTVSGFDTKRSKGSCERVAIRLQICVADGGTLEQQRWPIGPLVCRFAQVIDQCARGIRLQRSRHSFVIIREPSGFGHCVLLERTASLPLSTLELHHSQFASDGWMMR